MKHLFYCVFFLGTLSAASQEISFRYDHSSLAVKDLDASAAFYSKVLQLEEIEVPYANPSIRWFSLGGPYQLHLIKVAEESFHSVKATHLALHVEDIDVLVAYLNAKNIPYWDWLGEEGKIAVRPDGIQQVYVQDPDGHWIEINDVKFP